MLAQKSTYFIIVSLFLSFSTPLFSNPQPFKKIVCCSYQQWPECLFQTLRCTKEDKDRANQYLNQQLQLVQACFLPEQQDHTLTWSEFLRHSENVYLISKPSTQQWIEWISHIKDDAHFKTFLKSPGAFRFFKEMTQVQDNKISQWVKHQIIEKINKALTTNSWKPIQIWSLQYILEQQICKHIPCSWLMRSHDKNKELFSSLPESIRSQITTTSESNTFIKTIPNHWLSNLKERSDENIFLTFLLIHIQVLDIKHTNISTSHINQLPKWMKSSHHFIKAVTPSIKSKEQQDSSWAVWWNGEIVHSIKKNHGLQRLFRKQQGRNRTSQKSKERQHKIACRIRFDPFTAGSDKTTMVIQVDPQALPKGHL